jgi:hypothetical protein
MEQLLPLEIKEKINFINSNFQQIETKKIYIDIIPNLNDIFDYLNKNSNDQIYKIFLFELKNKIHVYIDDQKKFLLSNKNFFETSNLKEKYFVSKLSDEVISNIISISKSKINLIRENIKKKKLERFDLTINGGIYILRIIRILNKEFKKNGTLDAVSEYLHEKCEVTSAALEISSEFSNWWKHKDVNRDSPKTLYAHLDRELKNLKAIIYLSDVSNFNGPLTFYPEIYKTLNINIIQNIIGRIINDFTSTTNNTLNDYYKFENKSQLLTNKRFENHFLNLPRELRFNSHFGWDIKSGSEIEKNLIAVEKKIVAPLGTFIVFDGSQLIHSGGLVEKGERIALQIIFGKNENILVFYIKKMRNFIKKLFLQLNLN